MKWNTTNYVGESGFSGQYETPHQFQLASRAILPLVMPFPGIIILTTVIPTGLQLAIVGTGVGGNPNNNNCNNIIIVESLTGENLFYVEVG